MKGNLVGTSCEKYINLLLLWYYIHNLIVTTSKSGGVEAQIRRVYYVRMTTENIVERIICRSFIRLSN